MFEIPFFQREFHLIYEQYFTVVKTLKLFLWVTGSIVSISDIFSIDFDRHHVLDNTAFLVCLSYCFVLRSGYDLGCLEMTLLRHIQVM